SVFKGSRFAVVVIAQLGATNDVLARPERKPRRQRRVQSRKPGSLALGVVKQLEAHRAAQPWREVACQVVDIAKPISGPGIRHVGRKAEKTFRGVTQTCADFVRV